MVYTGRSWNSWWWWCDCCCWAETATSSAQLTEPLKLASQTSQLLALTSWVVVLTLLNLISHTETTGFRAINRPQLIMSTARFPETKFTHLTNVQKKSKNCIAHSQGGNNCMGLVVLILLEFCSKVHFLAGMFKENLILCVLLTICSFMCSIKVPKNKPSLI